MLEGLSGGRRPRSTINNHSWQRLGRNVGIAIALTIPYFLLTKLSQGLMRESQPEFAFFWPPTGFATAIMICLRRPTRWLFLFGVPVANLVAELTVPVGTIGLGEMGMFAVGNVAEPLVTAALVERYLGANFSIERSRDLLGLFAAALVGITLSATWYACVYKLALCPRRHPAMPAGGGDRLPAHDTDPPESPLYVTDSRRLVLHRGPSAWGRAGAATAFHPR